MSGEPADDLDMIGLTPRDPRDAMSLQTAWLRSFLAVADNLERAKQYGLRAAVVVTTEPRAFVDSVAEWTGGRGVNVIIDLVGAKYLEANLNALSARGRLILVGTAAGAQAMLDFSTVMRKRLTIVGTVLRARSTEEKATATRLFAEQVVPLLADGTIKPVVDRVYKIEEIREAHARIESNESFGKIVLLIGGE